MAYAAHARVWETPVTVTGTGSVTLPGTPSTGYQTFAAAYASGDTCPYLIRDTVTNAWEAGTGTVTIATGVATLARTTVLESTNANALVNFAGNACDVQVDYPPSHFDLANNIPAGATGNLLGATGTAGVATAVTIGNGAAIVSGLFTPLMMGVFGPARIDAGLYFCTPGPYNAITVSYTGHSAYMPFDVVEAFTLTSMSIVQTAGTATSNVFVGLYTDTGSFQPSALVSGTSCTFAISTAATYTQTMSVALTPGRYWIRWGVSANTGTLGCTGNVAGALQEYIMGQGAISTLIGAYPPLMAWTDTNGTTTASPATPTGLSLLGFNNHIRVVLGS